ncbi:MAG: hypothetical protein ACE5D8_04980 [Fidelibacterota bacterium]
MLRSIRHKSILAVFALFTVLLTGSQGAILSPIVACIESDGDMHVETLCFSCTHGTTGYERPVAPDPCCECVDLPLWPETPDHNQALSAIAQPVPGSAIMQTVTIGQVVTEPSLRSRFHYIAPRVISQSQTILEAVRLLI